MKQRGTIRIAKKGLIFEPEDQICFLDVDKDIGRLMSVIKCIMFRRLENEFEYTLRKDTREYREYQEILARPNELPNLFTEIDDDWHVEC